VQCARPSRVHWRKDGEFSSFVCRFSTNLHLGRHFIAAIVVEMSHLRLPSTWDGHAVQSLEVPALQLYAELPDTGYVHVIAVLEQFLWSQLRRVNGLVVADIYAVLRQG